MQIPYYTVVKGYGYWRPKKSMMKLGFARIQCGKDGSAAWEIADEWNKRWQRVRRGEEQPPIAVIGKKVDPEIAESALVYPRGSIGAGFKEFRTTEEWKLKAPRTREEWWRAWAHIKPVFGDMRGDHVTLKQISKFRENIKKKVSQREAHRVIKIWRALWNILVALKLATADADPSLGVKNTAAKGRTDTWFEGEVVRMCKHAWRTDRRVLSAALAVLWDSQLSPGDVPALVRSQVQSNGGGSVFFTERGKTDVAVTGALQRRAVATLAAYVGGLGFELHDDAPLFWTPGAEPGPKGGRRYRSAPMKLDWFQKEFVKLRRELFGEGEDRQLLDFRRSGAVEAIMGDATREDLGTAMGNGIAKSDELFDTYVPVNLTMLNAFHGKRRLGRSKRHEHESETKVPTRRLAESQLASGTRRKPLR